MRLNIGKSHRGYTLIELVIVLAIVSIILLQVVGSSSQQNKVERFGGEMRSIANILKVAQTDSYSVRTDDCPTPGTCFWRGTVVEIDQAASTIATKLILGDDLSGQSSTSNLDQRLGITGTKNRLSVDLSKKGISIQTISYNAVPTSTAAIAFLAPDSSPYSTSSIPVPTPATVATLLYPDRMAKIVLTFKDSTTSLTGIITFNGSNGIIEVTSVK